MQAGRKIKLIPIPDGIAERAPGVDIGALEKIIKFLNEKLKNRRAPFYIYINPNVPELAEKIECNVNDVMNSFKFLCGFYPDYIQMKAILKVPEDDLFYILKDEDLEELNKNNQVFHPDGIGIVYSDAERIIRHAYVMGLPKEGTYEYR